MMRPGTYPFRRAVSRQRSSIPIRSRRTGTAYQLDGLRQVALARLSTCGGHHALLSRFLPPRRLVHHRDGGGDHEHEDEESRGGWQSHVGPIVLIRDRPWARWQRRERPIRV